MVNRINSEQLSLAQYEGDKKYITNCKLCSRPMGDIQATKHLDCTLIGGNAIIQELKDVFEYLRKKQISNIETVEEHIDRRLDNVRNEMAMANNMKSFRGHGEL